MKIKPQKINLLIMLMGLCLIGHQAYSDDNCCSQEQINAIKASDEKIIKQLKWLANGLDDLPEKVQEITRYFIKHNHFGVKADGLRLLYGENVKQFKYFTRSSRKRFEGYGYSNVSRISIEENSILVNKIEHEVREIKREILGPEVFDPKGSMYDESGRLKKKEVVIKNLPYEYNIIIPFKCSENFLCMNSKLLSYANKEQIQCSVNLEFGYWIIDKQYPAWKESLLCGSGIKDVLNKNGFVIYVMNFNGSPRKANIARFGNSNLPVGFTVSGGKSRYYKR